MSWTKRQIVLAAFSDLGLANAGFELEADQLLDAARMLDNLMATWNARGIRLGYAMETYTTINLDTDSALTDMALTAVIKNLALEVGPSYGRDPMPATKKSAREAYRALLALSAVPPSLTLPAHTPLGAGNKPWRTDSPFLAPEEEDIDAGPDGILEFP